MEIDSNSSLISSPHPSLYELKKENGNEPAEDRLHLQ
jgi:hypothetical protein